MNSTRQPIQEACQRKMIWRWDSFSPANASQSEAKLGYHHTEHPNSLPASYCFPGQHKGVVSRVCFTSARPARFWSGMRPSQLCRARLSQHCSALSTAIALCVALFIATPCRAFYNPSTGRWLSRDPIAEPGFRPRETNEENARNAEYAALYSLLAQQQSAHYRDSDLALWGVGVNAASRPASGKQAEFNGYDFVGNAPISMTDSLGLALWPPTGPPNIPGIWTFFFSCPNPICDKWMICGHVHAPCLRSWPAHPVEHLKCKVIAWRKLTEGCVTGNSAKFKEGCEQMLACHLQFFHGD